MTAQRAPAAALLVAAMLAFVGVRPATPPAVPNDNTRPAGALRGGVLTLALEARLAAWHPDGDSLPGIAVEAFAERGGRPQAPGPLVRVARGTEIRISVRNALGRDALTFHLPGADSAVVPPGATREVRVVAAAPGTYVYRATTSAPLARALRMGGLLAGAVVVDSTAMRPRDRVFVLQTVADTVGPGGEPLRAVHAVNGRSWPHTERLRVAVGDRVHWRVINAANTTHPMHLHGFYFRVDALDGPRVADEGQGAPGRMVVTERMPPFSTMSMTWVPERAGNWLFHCHFQEHVIPHGPLNAVGPGGTRRRIGPAAAAGTAHHVPGASHASTGMGGLVLGVLVAPTLRGAAQAPTTVAGRAERRLRLVATQDAAFPDSQPSMRFVLEEPAAGTRADAGPGISPTIVLARGEPVAITIANRMREAVAVHWHGIELESYFDGVAGFSGVGTRVAPQIAPNDSFVARFTPPRAGTFMYHSHVEEPRHHRAGLVGGLLVRDAARPVSTDDVVFVLKTSREGGLGSDGGIRTAPVPIEINGRAHPDTTVLRAGRRYRIRLVGVQTGRANATVWLTARPDSAPAKPRDTMVATWTPVAKDGADLPPDARIPRPARQIVSMGETYDFEFAPVRRGQLRLEVRAASEQRQLLGRAPIRVE